ncbi:MAG: type 2 isopentenyl-diphosphate Delta-isomerase [Thermoplasmata archaeon]|nr:MAG: type 2 isopentenyl-diphosphate Delta-isomerase [Thermoplasmata archaeon]
MTPERKADHVDICLNKPVNASYNYWDDVKLVHSALPELNYDDIDTRIKLFDKELSAPVIIAAMTGGFKTDKYDAEQINGNLAEAAATAGVGMGVGSQRAALKNRELERTFSVVKGYDVPLVIGNIGAPQLVPQKEEKTPLTKDELQSAREQVGADIIAVHLNYLQEICMVDGDLNALDCLKALKDLASDIPLLAKETGAGLSREAALKLKEAGVAGLDVGGLGGTSFAAVEKHRAEHYGDKVHERIGTTFWDWGIPTPISVLESNVGLPLIATGGVRNGSDIASALVLGANAAGMARQFLAAAVESAAAVTELLNIIIDELKSSMFLLGAGTVKDLADKNYILTGKTYQWYQQRQEHLGGRF